MQKFEMVAKTLMGLEEVLAEELRGLGAENVEPGKRMVSFQGDTEMLYKANLCCRTALRILKPFYKFTAHTPDELYEQVKDFDWSTILDVDKTFCIDSVVYSEDFTHSHFVTYRVKDAIVDWFRDKYGDKRPGVRLNDADIMINVHISGGNVTLSLDSSGESLHKRGYRVAQTEAPINEVLAAGIILMSGWRGDAPFVDPMCGSGTFLVEAALIAANINPGIYRKSFAFENWPDFDQELFDNLYNDDSNERPVAYPIIGADIAQEAVNATIDNLKSAGVAKYVQVERKPIAHWEEAPEPAGVLVTNPPYGQRISSDDMEGLYATIGNRLKNVFQGYHAWIIGYRDEYFMKIGLAPSQKIPVLNGQLECELREYVIFEGDKKTFLAEGGRIKHNKKEDEDSPRREHKRDRDERRDFKRDRDGDRRDRREFRRDGDERRDFKRDRDGDRRDRREFRRDGDERRDFKRDRDGERRDKREFRRDGDERRDFKRDRDGERRDKRDFRRDGERRDKREFVDRKNPESRFTRRFESERTEDATQTAHSENPLAARRNPDMLKLLQNKQPSLPASSEEKIDNGGVVMRKRGWRKK